LLDDIGVEFAVEPYDFRLLTADSSLPANPTNSTSSIDCIILAVAHDAFKEITLNKLKAIMNTSPILIDVPGFFNKEEARQKRFHYKTL